MRRRPDLLDSMRGVPPRARVIDHAQDAGASTIMLVQRVDASGVVYLDLWSTFQLVEECIGEALLVALVRLSAAD